MSRFYDALKEASRLTGQNPGEAVWESVNASIGETAARDQADGKVPQPSGTPFQQEIPELNAEALNEDLLKLAAIPRDAEALGEPGPVLVGATAETLEPGLESRNEELPEAAGVSTPDPKPSNGSLLFAKKIVFDPSARLIPYATDTAVVEHYRRLRTKVLQQHAAKPFQSLMVTSPGPQEGKTVTVLNLALSFAMLPNFRVLVVDGDLRRGSIGKWLGADDSAGLSNLLEGNVQLEDVILKGAEIPIHVVTRGNSGLPPAELLHSPHLAAQFHRMTEHFDLVLVDSPPVTLITDAQLLGGSCDAVLLIARAFATTRKSLEQAVQELSSFRLIGTVLNGGTRAQLYHRYNGYYSS